MKKCIFIFSMFLILFSCQNANNNNDDMNNGIDKRILQIIDTLPLCPDVQNFVTIWFSSDTIANTIIRVFNGVLIPAPPEPPELCREVLISEMSEFKGYKKYNDWYIVFLQDTFNNKFDRFIVADSLELDEKPFVKYDVYSEDIGKNYKHCERVEKVYRIAENDSLILLNRDNDNVPR